MTLASLSLKKLADTQSDRVTVTPSIDMSRVAAIVLGGGQGTRLSPLTFTHCKPAINFGGRYRLIDIPMSNAINSGCLMIYIITQFLSTSLHKHILNTYRSGNFSPGFIELLTAEQKPTEHSWFQGTADAVRQNLNYFSEASIDYFLILSGDQLYNMHFQHMVKFAKETNADLVVAALPVAEAEAKRMGVLKVNEDRFIVDFREKPQERVVLDQMSLSESTLKQLGVNFNKNHQYLGSMGIYLFKRKALFDLLQADPREDFGKHLIPTKVSQGNVAAYLYDDYWEDIGTIESFFKANIALTVPNPLFNCYHDERPIFSAHLNLPPPKTFNTYFHQAILCEGSVIENSEITNSIVGPRTIIKSGSTVRNSYLMGNDFYKSPFQVENLPDRFIIEEGCFLDHVILDKNVWIGKRVKLINKNKLKNYNSEGIYIRDGIIIVTRGTHVPDGFVL